MAPICPAVTQHTRPAQLHLPRGAKRREAPPSTITQLLLQRQGPKWQLGNAAQKAPVDLVKGAQSVSPSERWREDKAVRQMCDQRACSLFKCPPGPKNEQSLAGLVVPG